MFLVFPDFQILDLTGPMEVFSQAERIRDGSYRLRTIALEPGHVVASCGLTVLAAPAEPFDSADTLIVVGGRGTRGALEDPRYPPWLAAASARSHRTDSCAASPHPLDWPKVRWSCIG